MCGCGGLCEVYIGNELVLLFGLERLYERVILWWIGEDCWLWVKRIYVVGCYGYLGWEFRYYYIISMNGCCSVVGWVCLCCCVCRIGDVV